MPKPYFHNKNHIIDEILRVNHAGEYGAVRIYKGQIDGITVASNIIPIDSNVIIPIDSNVIPAQAGIQDQYKLDSHLRGNDILHHMLDQEKIHLAYFESQIQSHHSRPTIFLPLWHMGGYLMGKISAMIGPKTAMLCTEAVEEVIDEHYQSQKQILHDIGEKELAGKVEQFRLEELEHRDIAIEHGSKEAPVYRAFKGVINKICRVAIWMSKVT